MESFEQKLHEADKRIHVADHMLTSTYPLLRDPKLLLGVLDNLHGAFQNAISAFMEYERYFKRIPPYNRSSEFMTFKLKAPKYGLSGEYTQTFEKLSDAVALHKNSPVEFSRNDSFVIASESYSLKKLSPDELKKDIKTCRAFIAIVRKNMLK